MASSLRKNAHIHAVDKASIVDSELGGEDEVVTQLFSENVPYCDLDLTPKFDYDLDKAVLLNCPLCYYSTEASSDSPYVVGMTWTTGSLDPRYGSTPWSLTTHGLAEKLFTVDKNGEIVGQVAECHAVF